MRPAGRMLPFCLSNDARSLLSETFIRNTREKKTRYEIRLTVTLSEFTEKYYLVIQIIINGAR